MSSNPDTALENYLSELSFRFIKPLFPIRAPYSLVAPPDNWVIKSLIQVQTVIEFINTKLPYTDPERDKRIKQLCRIPKMSTYAVGSIIDKIVETMPPHCAFVNIGVWYGFTFLAGLINNPDKTCIGIDNFAEFGGPKEDFLKYFNRYKSPAHSFYEMDYRDYLAKVHKGEIGFYIYDGYNSYESQIEALRAAEPFFSDRCVVMIDDTNIVDRYSAAQDFIKQSPCQYRILLDQKTYTNAHPTFWDGIMIFQRLPRQGTGAPPKTDSHPDGPNS